VILLFLLKTKNPKQMKKVITLLLSFIITFSVIAQKDWSKVNFADEYKRKVKLSGGFVKSLKNNPTYVTNYQLHQATVMKGSETTATSGVFAEIKIAGLDQETYQDLTDEMYNEFIKELTDAGINIVNGDELFKTKNAQKKLSNVKKGEVMGNTGDNPAYEVKKKIQDGSIPGYGAWAVTRGLSFPPRNTNILYTDNVVKAGPFFMNLAKKGKTNIIHIDFYISFASFDGARGYKDISIKADPVIAVSMMVRFYGANGSMDFIEYKKLPVWGSNDWSLGVEKTKENDGSAFGLSSSADFQVTADPGKYMEETKNIIKNLQKDVVNGIKEEL
jgi:hypothetical protein